MVLNTSALKIASAKARIRPGLADVSHVRAIATAAGRPQTCFRLSGFGSGLDSRGHVMVCMRVYMRGEGL